METRKVILVADDEAAIRNSVREILDEEGYDVLMAADGNEALRLSQAQKGTIDLLLTDVEMPRIDGVTASKRFLSDRPDAKVLFMSGGTKLPDLFGQVNFLKKPFSLDELLEKVHEILQDASNIVQESMTIVLVVDHDRERMKRLNNILSRNGYLVLKAASIEEAEEISAVASRIDQIVVADGNIDTLPMFHVHQDPLNAV